ncbi:MAG: glycosyltransferase family 4 protein [Caldilineaceae bacterium]|nr:glycosyltransferase family 4 protein [Caldilineaceae bacterium]
MGRQVYQKGQRFLLDAVGQLAAQRDNLLLIVAGPQGGATAELEQLHAQSGLGDRVRFLGNRTDVPEILAAADLFVFPSLYEGLPGALIEAIALGLPVVASNIAPVAEVVEDRRNALLVPPESSVDLADAIRTLLEERPMAQAFGERSREIFLERFTLERSMERMVELYDRLLNQSEQLGAKVF